MIYPAYPKYKDSGVEWLGEVPAHWEVTKLSYITNRIGSGKTPSGGATAYVSSGVPFIRSQNVHDQGLRLGDIVYIDEATDREMAWSRVRPLDVLMNITGASIGRSCQVPVGFGRANVNQHVCVIRLEKSQEASGWVAWFMKAPSTKEQVKVGQTGAAREGLNFEQLASFCLCMPPINERKTITAFLDHETARIDALVEEQQRLIELLKEKRQAVISHAVTKGLDPDVPMKDSGVEWLGKVPEHWDVKPLMRLTPPDRKIMYGIVLPGPDFDGGVPIIKGGDVKPGRLSLEKLCRTDPKIEAKYERSRVASGDIVYSIRGGIGDAEIVPEDISGSNLTQDAARVSPRDGVCNAWLLYALKSGSIFSQLEAKAAGATIRGINIMDLKRAAIPVPPSQEQQKIAEKIGFIIGKLDRLEKEAGAAIILMQERRSALISAAVTGKIDVRGWQPPADSALATGEATQMEAV
ncbi:MAG: restriction endonuclease subunit S [Pseudomonadota bacterium]